MTEITLQDASGIAGWISIACWIIVYTPQIWENYQLKSGEGLSVAFVILWLIGDLTNLAGGAMAHLLPTMIILAVYYSLCDVILLFQIYYYRAQHRKATEDPEREPLHRARTHSHSSSTHPKPPAPLLPAWIHYPLLLLFVSSVGVAAWYIQARTNHPNGGVPDGVGKTAWEWKSQVLGYSSMLLYIGSRVPQIAHNAKTRCEGLSLSLFFFSISGNLTYVASILLKSVERSYVIANISWLIGSGGTVFLDLIVLGQFMYYNSQNTRDEYMDDSDSSDD
ncbi:putative vacuolar membrane transporter [Naganishia albida]|nr:putative vacuolar membrane transporter [Naganishia albida]